MMKIAIWSWIILLSQSADLSVINHSEKLSSTLEDSSKQLTGSELTAENSNREGLSGPSGTTHCDMRREENGHCCICIQSWSEDNRARIQCPKCEHYFHQTCLGKWCLKSNTCPMCRAPNPTGQAVIWEASLSPFHLWIWIQDHNLSQMLTIVGETLHEANLPTERASNEGPRAPY
ncbi:hypothetical protein PGT21_018785 [Puccinia graminis f. sp. tritici]|uniref:RING-type domain-containing protein n=1 Tax=Puccinia graminis f. sp. tritici TaxID=56615 RepID=A0A5B0NUF3_PUCGR|nr:hypothetical protein PGT21_018785 [Puccinia graminis f. sp. tritici]